MKLRAVDDCLPIDRYLVPQFFRLKRNKERNKERSKERNKERKKEGKERKQKLRAGVRKLGLERFRGTC